MTRCIDCMIFVLALLAAAGAECVPLSLILVTGMLGLTILKEILLWFVVPALGSIEKKSCERRRKEIAA